MDQEKAVSLLNRQLIDIQAQADKILRGDDSAAAIESLSRYSDELKKFIREKIDNHKVVDASNDIPDINYERSQIQLWQYLIFPVWWINLYKDYQARKKSLEEVTDVRGKYASLQLLLR